MRVAAEVRERSTQPRPLLSEDGRTRRGTASPRFTASGAGRSGSFTDTSTDPDGMVIAWHWSFGDGTSATTRHPTHGYVDAFVMYRLL